MWPVQMTAAPRASRRISETSSGESIKGKGRAAPGSTEQISYIPERPVGQKDFCPSESRAGTQFLADPDQRVLFWLISATIRTFSAWRHWSNFAATLQEMLPNWIPEKKITFLLDFLPAGQPSSDDHLSEIYNPAVFEGHPFIKLSKNNLRIPANQKDLYGAGDQRVWSINDNEMTYRRSKL